MLRRSLRTIFWLVVIGLSAYFVYTMQNYKIQQTEGQKKIEGAIKVVPRDVLSNLTDLSRYEKVAENDRLKLFFEPFSSSLAVEDKKTGAVWSSASNIKEEEIGGSALLKNSVKAVFNFTYSDTARPVHEVQSYNSISAGPEITKQNIENGIRVNYNFTRLALSFDIEYSIKDNYLEVHVPASSIKEKGSMSLLSIEPLPNLGSGTDKDKGYMVYPDGSGALAYFKEDHPEYTRNYSQLVYGAEKINFRENEIREENAFLPVFGVHKNDNGYVAFATEGEFETKINYYPSGYNRVNVNRVSSEYVFRRQYDAAIRRGDLVKRVESKLSKQDHRTRYVFLNKEQSEYADMANVYRQYLVDSGQLAKQIEDGGQIPLALDLFMGIIEERVLENHFVKATTFDQAEQYLKQLKNSGVDDMSVILRGWMSKGYGYYPMRSSAASELGGSSGLEKLARYAKSNQIDMYLNFNSVDADSENRGFYTQLDTVKTPNKLPLRNFFGDKYLLNGVVAKENFEDQGETLAEYGASGIDFDRFGQIAVVDYNDWNPLTREGTVKQWLDIMKQSKKQNGKTAVHGGNGYVLNVADRLSDIPLRDTGYSFSDEEIPLYPMIVHGYIPYSDDIPHNIHYDQKKHFLRWIEYGSMPYYELTYSKPEDYRFTRYWNLFSSSFKQWTPDLVKKYKEMNDQLGGTWSQPIVDHQKLDRDVYETTFGDGTRVVVNYSLGPYVDKGIKVDALNYTVIKEGEK